MHKIFGLFLPFAILLVFNTNFIFAKTSNKLRLAFVSDNPSKVIKRFTKLANYLAANLNQFNLKQGKVVVARDLSELILMFQNKEADIYMDSVMASFRMFDTGMVSPFLRMWKNGVKDYRSIIFTNSESNISSIKNLLGQTILFQDSGSTTSYLIPRAMINQQGLELNEISNFSETKANKFVWYQFAGNSSNLIVRVMRKRAQAAGLSEGDISKISNRTKKMIKILDKSPMVPRYLVNIRKDLNLNLKKALKNIFLDIDKDLNAKNILKKIKAKKFDEISFDNKGMIAAKELYPYIKSEIK